MVQTTEEKLRQERATLWRAKNLNRQFIGDESWMPCAGVESNQDWDLFEPQAHPTAEQSGRKRKRTVNEDTSNGVQSHPDHSGIETTIQEHGTSAKAAIGNSQTDGQTNGTHTTAPQTDEVDNTETGVDDVDMISASTNGVHVKKSPHDSPSDMLVVADGVDRVDQAPDGPADTVTNGNNNDISEDQEHASNDESLPPPTRRITRALAAETNTSTAPTPPLSPSSTITSLSSSLLVSDPIFLLSASVTASHHFPSNSLARFAGLQLPVEELLETRRLLTMYIQKQEESVRGYETMLAKLIKAKRMRDRVYGWAKAEGHVGEMEDGEDWIDLQVWGLKEGELSKGKDEEETAEHAAEEVGRKGKRRRRE